MTQAAHRIDIVWGSYGSYEWICSCGSRGEHRNLEPPPRVVERARLGSRVVSPALRWAVMKRDDSTCQACGHRSEQFMTCDHIIPWSKGGPTVLENLQAMCQPCNVAKGNSLPSDGIS